jgi:uncharacterized protein YfaS (alpha-2-macroglobulin family)
MRPALRVLPTLSLLCALAVCAAPLPASSAGVESFSPLGDAKRVRQVAARFATPMVPFGDPRRLEPFAIDCPASGTGSWVDERNWVFDFDADLPAGLRCSFTVRPGTTDLAGAAVAAEVFAFSTGGPAVRETLPWAGSDSIDEEQVFILALDAQATEASVTANAYCDVAGRADRVPVRVVGGAERRSILDRQPDFVASAARAFLDQATARSVLARRDYDALPLLLLACRGRLPNEAQVRLVWGRGIASASGVASDTDQVLAFRVRPAFTATFSCERTNPAAGCIPVLPMRVDFSAPVAAGIAGQVRLEGADGKTYRPQPAGAANRADFVDSVTFAPPFPESAQFRVLLPAGLVDDAGRRPDNARRFPLAVRTDAAPPLAKFAARFGILELHADPALPITLRNVEPVLTGRTLGATGVAAAQPKGLKAALLRVQSPREIAAWLRRLDGAQAKWSREGYTSTSVFQAGDRTRAFTLPKPGGGREFEVVGIPLPKPGFYVVEVVSPRLGRALLKDGAPYYVSAAALVTNMAVHFKWGRASSLAWVTALDTGRPIPGADVLVMDCGGKVLFSGSTDADGIARIRKALPQRDALPGCREAYDRELFVSARRGEDVSFTFTDWGEGIAPWRFNLRPADSHAGEIAATVFDRTLVRAGDTVGMKHFFRRRTSEGFALAGARALPVRAVIRHEGSDQRWELPLRWDAAAGVAESVFEVPRDARVGSYAVTLAGPRAPGEDEAYFVPGQVSGTFRVEEFRVPTMRATLEPAPVPLVNATAAEFAVQLSYLSGGAAAHQRVRLRSVVRPASVVFAEFEDVRFASGDVREGRVDAARRPGFVDETDGEPGRGASGQARSLGTQTLTLDAGGAATARVGDLPWADTPRELVTELEYADPNGEVLTRSARVTLWPAAVLLGIRPDGWALAKDSVRVETIAVDTAGRPLADVAVQVDLYERLQYGHRKRLVGGFYAYEYGAEIRRVGEFCAGRTDARGRLFCESPVQRSGNLILRARAQDAQGNASVTTADVWVAGDGEWWFDVGDHDRMDVIPERRRYEAGEKATVQVRAPFRQATALVTVEREGILDAFVTQLSGKAPVVQVPLPGRYAPNAFVSVLAVRGRVGGVQPTALVDLGRPAFRMGVAEVAVGWQANTLQVEVKPDRSVFKVRETARVSIAVRRALDGRPPGKGAEVAVAAVDEGLLELLPNASWNLLDTMMQPRGIDVETATGVQQVIGKRHFGKKAVPPGGGGGQQGSRELFDTRLYWKARVRLDEAGRADVEVPLNDTLTAFRIVAIATSGAGLFGTGQATIRSTQDVMLLSGLPAVVREQDRFDATFTVRNAAGRPLTLDVDAVLTPQPGRAGDPGRLETRRIALAAGAAAELTWQVAVPLGADRLAWRVTAREAGDTPSGVGDDLAVMQRVVPAVPVRVVQATLARLEDPLSVPIEPPADAIAGRGDIAVTLRSRLAETLGGVRDYMAAYPYTCFEQRASVAVALRDVARWSGLMTALPAYLDRDGLVGYFPGMAQGSDTLTAYLLAVAHEAGWSIPAPARDRMLSGLLGFVSGTLSRRGSLPTADLAIRKVAALEALSRYDVPLDPALASGIAIEPDRWPTSAVIDWLATVKRWEALPERESQRAAAERVLRSRLDLRGTALRFSTESQDALWWLMISGDVNANRALLALLDEPQWRSELPRLVRGSLGRQQFGRWNTTVANAWGTLALEKFSAVFEAEKVSGVTRGAIGTVTRTHEWQRREGGGALAFDWPRGPAVLTLAHEGPGRPWVTVQGRAAIPLQQPFASGYRIARSVTKLEGAPGGGWRRGDVYRVRLDLEAQTDMTWVVVSDPIPAGATILGGGLGGDAALLAADEESAGRTRPAFEERTHEAFRAYYRFVPKGAWSVEYTVRLNNPGTFELPASRVEALYAPELFAEIPNARMTVAP